MAVRTGHAQHPGRRARQEDCLAALRLAPWQAETLLVVADGMGGHPAGDQASRLTVSGFVTGWLEQGAGGPSALRRALDAANDRLAGAQATDPTLAGMGSTCLAVTLSQTGRGAELLWISVGDCLLFLFRDGRLSRLNADHSMAPMLNRLAETGELDPAEARDHPDRHALMSAVTGGPLRLIDAPAEALRLQEGDCILLSSDGLLTLDDAAISACLAASAETDPRVAAAALVDRVLACDADHQDNISVLLAMIGETPPRQPGPRRQDLATTARVAIILALALAGLILLVALGQLVTAGPVAG